MLPDRDSGDTADPAQHCAFGGTYTVLNDQTGAVLRTAPSSRTPCARRAAISQGNVLWGTGYNQFMVQPIAPSAVTAFTVK